MFCPRLKVARGKRMWYIDTPGIFPANGGFSKFMTV